MNPDAGVILADRLLAARAGSLPEASRKRTAELVLDAIGAALVHATATTVPVALAVAEQSGGISGRRFVDAITLGNDIACRLALALDMPLGGADRRPRVMSLTYQTGVLAGRAGWYPAFFGGRFDYSRDRLLHELGERFLGDEISIKPFVCC